jgi:YggT family protein
MSYSIYSLIDMIFQGLNMIIFIRIILSWIPHNMYNPIITIIYQVSEPILKPFRDLVPSHRIGIDLSPIFAFIALSLLRRVIFQLL